MRRRLIDVDQKEHVSTSVGGAISANQWIRAAGAQGPFAPLFGLPEVGAHLHQAYAKSGYPGVLRQWAKELEYLAAHKQAYYPGAIAQTYAALGDKDRAFYWLEQYSQHRNLASADPTVYFKTDPWFAPLRSDPLFGDFLRHAGLSL